MTEQLRDEVAKALKEVLCRPWGYDSKELADAAIAIVVERCATVLPDLSGVKAQKGTYQMGWLACEEDKRRAIRALQEQNKESR